MFHHHVLRQFSVICCLFSVWCKMQYKRSEWNIMWSHKTQLGNRLLETGSLTYFWHETLNVAGWSLLVVYIRELMLKNDLLPPWLMVLTGVYDRICTWDGFLQDMDGEGFITIGCFLVTFWPWVFPDWVYDAPICFV